MLRSIAVLACVAAVCAEVEISSEGNDAVIRR